MSLVSSHRPSSGAHHYPLCPGDKTKCNWTAVMEYMLGMSFDYDYVPANGSRGGVLVAWRSDVWSVSHFHHSPISCPCVLGHLKGTECQSLRSPVVPCSCAPWPHRSRREDLVACWLLKFVRFLSVMVISAAVARFSVRRGCSGLAHDLLLSYLFHLSLLLLFLYV
jgi:hypothetical protein